MTDGYGIPPDLQAYALAELRRHGALSGAEFEAEKARVLAGP
jgi:hypothetical protein